MKDPAKEGLLQVQLPAPTETLDKEHVMQDVDVPFYENFVCSLTYNASTKNLEGAFPTGDAVIHTLQSCGVMPVYKWLSGTYKETGSYLEATSVAKACKGTDWTV